MWFAPETLSVITTYQCTAACEHCCFSCSPGVTRAIPLPRLYALVEETAEVPSMVQVVFTGGECFLLGRHLDALIARCHGRGLMTRCVTNGYWATSPASARARVGELREAGLQELNFSTGVHHARFVPWERVAWGAAAAAEGGMEGVVINIEAFEGSTFDVAALTGHPLLEPHLASGRARAIQAPWIQNGGEWGAGERGGCSGAKPLAHAEADHRFYPGHAAACDSSLRVVSVTPDLDLISCCGLNLEHIPEVHVASLRHQTLREALEGVPPDLLKMWLHVEGPERILEFVKEREPAFPLPLDSAHICHTCQYLHQSPVAMAVVARHREEVEGRVLEAYLLGAVSREIAAAL